MFYTLPFVFTLIAIAYISCIHIIHAIFASRCIALHRSVELRVLMPKREPSQAKSRRHLQNKRQNPLKRNAEGCRRNKDGALSSQEPMASAYPKTKPLHQKLTSSIMGFHQKLTSSVMGFLSEIDFISHRNSSKINFVDHGLSSKIDFIDHEPSSEIDFVSHGLSSEIDFIDHGPLSAMGLREAWAFIS
jgi:hypothetical protein